MSPVSLLQSRSRPDVEKLNIFKPRRIINRITNSVRLELRCSLHRALARPVHLLKGFEPKNTRKHSVVHAHISEGAAVSALSMSFGQYFGNTELTSTYFAAKSHGTE